MRGGVVAMLIGSDRLQFEVAAAAGVRKDLPGVGRTLGQKFSELAARAALHGLGLSTTLLLADTLGANADALLKEVLNNTRLFQQVVGAAAADEGHFRVTPVGGPAVVARDVAACIHVFDARPWGIGVAHGFAPPERKPLTVTKAQGSYLHEIDRRPAFEVYREHAAELGQTLEPETAGPFLVQHQLGVMFLDRLKHVRAPIGVGPSGELRLLGSVETGEQVCLLDTSADALIDGCRRAAEQARAQLGGPAAGVLVFDCVCRGMVLGREFQRELDAIRGVFPDVPLAGFLANGQVAKGRTKLEGWHNSTVVVVAVPE